MFGFLKDLYNKAEKKVQSEIPWYATDNGKLCIDVDEFVKRDCWKQSLEDFEAIKKELK